MIRQPPKSPPFPYTPFSRSEAVERGELRQRDRQPDHDDHRLHQPAHEAQPRLEHGVEVAAGHPPRERARSEEHTSELQSRQYLVCRLLLEKKKKRVHQISII